MKHNKKRNVGIIYELLLKYISKNILEGNKVEAKKATRIVESRFKKGTELNGKNPTILYGYGGFNISQTPGFRVTNSVWLEQGGIYAVPNIRGGGEYG